MALKKSQKSLKKWTKQKWRTASGKKSSETGEVYAPSAKIKKLKSTDNIRLSYYVSTNDAINCSKILKSNIDKSFDRIKECSSLKKDLLKIKISDLFSDISFDFRGFEAIKRINFLKNFSWNTWNVKNEDLNNNIFDNFHMIILNNTDPNSL